MKAWRKRRDSSHGAAPNDEIFDQAFAAADCFKPHDVTPRNAVDIGEGQLKKEVLGFVEILDGR